MVPGENKPHDALFPQKDIVHLYGLRTRGSEFRDVWGGGGAGKWRVSEMYDQF